MKRFLTVTFFGFIGFLVIRSALNARAVPANRTERNGSLPVAAMADSVPTNLLAQVLPAFDNQPADNRVTFTEAGKTWTFFVASRNGRYAGVAFESKARGYAGLIHVFVGVNATGTIQKIAITRQQETEGVGARISEDDFQAQFAGRDILKTQWKTTVNGGDIDAVTGATISSEGVVTAIKSGLNVYIMHLDSIRQVVERNVLREQVSTNKAAK